MIIVVKIIIRALVNILIDVLPVPDVRKYFDRDMDGKFTKKDLRSFKWFEFAGAAIICLLLVYLEIVDVQKIEKLLKMGLSLLSN